MPTAATSDDDAWKQIVAGIDAMQWSRLSSWDSSTAQLSAARDRDLFNKHWKTIHPRSGRWLCWMTFAVGAESLTRGAFALHGYEIPHSGFGASQPWAALKMPQQYQSEVAAAIHKLASDVRNRDAHRYWGSVRNNDFPLIDSRFVPALNRIIECLDRELLLKRYHGSSENSL